MWLDFERMFQNGFTVAYFNNNSDDSKCNNNDNSNSFNNDSFDKSHDWNCILLTLAFLELDFIIMSKWSGNI